MSGYNTIQILGLCLTLLIILPILVAISIFSCITQCHRPFVIIYKNIIQFYYTKFNNYQNIIDRNYEEL